MTRRRRADDDDDDLATGLQRNDSGRGQQSYRSLLHENMSLLDKLRQQEDLCRALESQMGDIDSKMDNVADQHLRTLGEAEGMGMFYFLRRCSSAVMAIASFGSAYSSTITL